MKNIIDPASETTEVRTTTIPSEATIVRKIEIINELNEKIKEHKESLDAIAQNDLEMSEAEARLVEAKQNHKSRQAVLNQTLEVQQIKFKIMDLREEVKEIKEVLNEDIHNYVEKSGQLSFEFPSGQVATIKRKYSWRTK